VVSVTPLSRFNPGERTLCTHCTGGWVGSRTGLDTKATGKILSHLPGIELRSPGRPNIIIKNIQNTQLFINVSRNP
jgi:hypothetical protein